MLVLVAADGTPEHVLVRAADGRLLDIGGARDPSQVVRGGKRLCPVVASDLDELHSLAGWAEPDAETAAAWIPALQKHIASGRPWREVPSMRLTTTIRGLEFQFSWDGDSLVAVRSRIDSLHEWTLVGAARLAPGADDDPIEIDFSEEAFMNAVSDIVARLKIDSIRSRLDVP